MKREYDREILQLCIPPNHHLGVIFEKFPLKR